MLLKFRPDFYQEYAQLSANMEFLTMRFKQLKINRLVGCSLTHHPKLETALQFDQLGADWSHPCA